MLSTEHLVFSVLISRNAREDRPLFTERLVICSRQARRAEQVWEHGRSIDTGRDVYKPCLCHTEGRNQDGSRKALYQGSAFSGELPGVPRRTPTSTAGK